MSNKNNDKKILAENKVLILYILNQLEDDITENGLFQIVSSINNVNYFYFKQFLTDLIDSNLVEEYNKDTEQLLRITSKGRNSLSLTLDILPGIVKLKADNVFKKELSTIEEASSVIAEFIPKNETDYTVKCKIVENNETIFEVKTFAGSRERAKQIVDNWNNNATKIYPEILNILLKED